MAFVAQTRSDRGQAVFTGFMVVLAFVLFILMIWMSVGLLTVQTLFTGATFLDALGLAAAVWRRRAEINALSVALVLIGVASLAMMTIVPVPSIDPFISATGRWVRGPLSFRLGWARMGMAVLVVLTGLALPYSQSRRHLVALGALTLVRFSLWVGVFWQLAYVAIQGDFGRLFGGYAIFVQVALAITLVISALLLLRGDRGWLAALTEADRTVSLARFILPMTVIPVISAYMSTQGVLAGLFRPELDRVMNAEVSSVTLLIAGTAALRSLWRERRGRENLARVLEQSPVIVHSDTGQIEYWPRGCEKLFGYTAREAVGVVAKDLLKTELPVPAEEILAILRKTGEWAGEVRRTARNGDRLWIAMNLVMDRSTDGSEFKLVETLTDITDLKVSKVALVDTTDSLTQAVATYDLGMVEFDAEAGRTTFSPEFERIVGVAPGSLGTEQRAWRRWMSTPDEADQVRDWVIEDVIGQVSKRNLTVKMRRADGDIRDLQGMLRYRYTPSGRLKGLVGIFMDVTEIVRDRAEMAAQGGRLLELQAELTHTSRLSAMGEMAAALAHELNQPLTAVGNSVGAIAMMLEDESKPVDDKKRRQVLRASRHAEAQAIRAGEIVRRLREFIARGEADTQVEDLDLLIADAVALALPNPAAVGITVRRFVGPGAATVLADRIQIQQVIVNLVRNAAEAMRDQQRHRILTICATAEKNMALVRVSDTGGGVAAENEDRLFSAFVSTKRDGMGVGLSICRRIIEAHGGQMWFQPADEGGAEFWFTLPIISSEASDDAT